MAEPLRRPASWPDLLALGEEAEAELIDGEILMSPRSKPVHGYLQAGLASSLFGPFTQGLIGPGGWWIVIECDVALSPHDIVSPDLVGWRRERVPAFPAERPVAVVPDWICEVLSPGTTRYDRIVKANLYLKSGVPFYWLVDPEERTLEALGAEEGRWVRLGAWTDEDTARIPPFEAIEINVGMLFPPGAGG